MGAHQSRSTAAAAGCWQTKTQMHLQNSIWERKLPKGWAVWLGSLHDLAATKGRVRWHSKCPHFDDGAIIRPAAGSWLRRNARPAPHEKTSAQACATCKPREGCRRLLHGSDQGQSVSIECNQAALLGGVLIGWQKAPRWLRRVQSCRPAAPKLRQSYEKCKPAAPAAPAAQLPAGSAGPPGGARKAASAASASQESHAGVVATAACRLAGDGEPWHAGASVHAPS